MALRSKTAEVDGNSLSHQAVGLIPSGFTVSMFLLPMCGRYFTCLDELAGNDEHRETIKVSEELFRFRYIMFSVTI